MRGRLQRAVGSDATPLVVAAEGGSAACVRALLDGGAGAGEADARGGSALYYAAQNGHAAVPPPSLLFSLPCFLL